MKSPHIIFQGKTKKGTEIVIRYPVMNDLIAMTDFMNAISKEQTFITFQGEQLSLKDEKKYLLDMLKKIKNGKAVKLFVFHENKLIGISDIIMQERTSSHVGIFGLIIARGYRGEGIGKLLMGHVIQEAIEHIPTLRIITLGVFANNPIAYNLYRSFGFSDTGTIPDGIHYKRTYVDHLLMHKMVV